ncbi:1-acyl-sn-glycerol-3-phosphate acyltransferase [Algirhabdus cladophorae]|uniref:1-acyl-sn-glycerol-3-phosphate acyltransferase n=1 Tax=Algirhabdus cladophorae TaxID=3377108 RepID=UPI003B847D53
MLGTVEMPVWALVIVVLFAAVTALTHVIGPSVRWFFRKRAERVVARVNEKLTRPIEPFKLARRHDMIQRLCYDEKVINAVADYAASEKVPEQVAFEKAQSYAREIVPSFSATAYFGIGTRVAKFLANALYRVRLGHVDADALRQIGPEATVVFIMNHRSNMDYVLVTYLAARASALSYAVGEWARVWPLSRLIRSMGAYFIRRKSRGELYRRVLARYVQLATAGGVTQAVFPEGGLSLDGRTAPPKLGLLSYIVDDFDPEGRDVVFVPVALNYDRVLEDRVLIAAGEEGTRRFRAKISVVAGFTLRQLWLRITGRFYRFGYASVSFGKPLSLAAFQTEHGTDAVDALGQEMMERINQVMPVLPVPLVATVLLRHAEPISQQQIEQEVQAILTNMQSAHVHLPRGDVSYAVEVGVRALVARKICQQDGAGIAVADAEKAAAQYYANSIERVISAHAV